MGENHSKSVVVTGASTGIGAATARLLAEAGWQVFAGVRDCSDAPKLNNVQPLELDVTDLQSIALATRKVEEELGTECLGGLVNNAGIAIGGPLAFQPIDEIRRTLEVNFFGAVSVTQAFLPLLGTDCLRKGPKGRIVNMSSVGGQIGPPFLGAYAASKHALEGYSESLRRELMLFGIDVIIVGPGSVATPIWDKAQARGVGGYTETPYGDSTAKMLDRIISGGKHGYRPEHIGSIVRIALESPRPRARYAPVQGKLMGWILPRFLPKRFVDRMIAKELGLNVLWSL
jgi:NAD(P)-dependent dehydrogenase (short-subunit alcohol dehydrogenase family)